MSIISILKSKKLALALLLILILLKAFIIYHSDISGDMLIHYYISKYIVENGQLPFFANVEIIPHIKGIEVLYTPLYHIVLAFFMLFTKSAEILKYLSILWMLITTYFLYKLFYKYDESGIIAVISNFNYVNFFIDPTGLHNYAFFTMFLIMSIYFYIKNSKFWILSFIAALATKQILGVLLVPIFLFDSWQQKKYKKLMIALAISAVFVLIYYLMFIGLYPTGEASNYNNTLGNYYVSLFHYSPYEFSAAWFETFLPFIFLAILGLKKEQLVFWVAGLSFSLIYLTGFISMKYFIPSGLFTFFLFYLFLKNMDFKYIRHFFIFLVALNLFLILIYANVNCVVNRIFNQDFFTFPDNMNCYYPPFKDSLNFIRENITTDDVIMTPFAWETYYLTGVPVTQNFNMTANNATKLYMVKYWITDRNKLWYNNVIWQNESNWSYIYESQDIDIISKVS